MTIYEMLLMAILGHFIGDYLFQPKWVAHYKTNSDWCGFWTCVLHCILYSLIISIMIGLGKVINPWVFGMVFLSHYPIDRYSLAQKWLDITGGRKFMNDYDEAVEYLNKQLLENGEEQQAELKTPVIVTSFGCIVYTITDNTLHIVLMWVGICLLNFYSLV